MALRSPQERIIQTLAFEIGGLFLVLPLFVLVTGNGAGEGFLLLAVLSVAVMIWSPLHNTVFDRLDLWLSGRVASARPQGWRMLHAISHEVTVVVVTLPIMLGLGGLSLGDALLANIGLTAVYTAYAYAFHLVYDRWRPVVAG
jgi:uncharacterized membrane protein